jgi:hypothetical protein
VVFLQTNGNVLNDYASNNTLVTVARLSLSVAIIFSSPLVLYACRRSFLTLFLSHLKNPRTGDYSWLIWIIVAAVIQVLVAIVGYFLTNIAVVFGFSGAVIGSTFVFFLPGLFFVQLGRCMPFTPISQSVNDSESLDSLSQHQPSRRLLLVTGWFLMICAVLLCALGTTGAALSAIANAHANATSTNMTVGCGGWRNE